MHVGTTVSLGGFAGYSCQTVVILYFVIESSGLLHSQFNWQF
jgi:hypothetical protein